MKTKFLALALVAAMPFAVSADEASYKYFDISYQFGGDIDVGIGSIDTDGFALKASVPFDDHWFFGFDYTDLSTDPSAIDTTNWAIKGGWRNDMFFATLGWESAEIDACTLFFPPCSFDDSGYNVDFGIRAMTSEDFEVNAHIGYSDLGDLDTFTNYGLGAVYMFGDNMGVSFNYEMRSGDGIDFTSMGLGFRLNFD